VLENLTFFLWEFWWVFKSIASYMGKLCIWELLVRHTLYDVSGNLQLSKLFLQVLIACSSLFPISSVYSIWQLVCCLHFLHMFMHRMIFMHVACTWFWFHLKLPLFGMIVLNTCAFATCRICRNPCDSLFLTSCPLRFYIYCQIFSRLFAS
jgi:hypothetical protein